jgi:hypothetical protein
VKVALCISGLARGAEETLPALRKRLIGPLKPDIFCAFWKTKGVSKTVDLYQPRDSVLIKERDLVPRFMSRFPYPDREPVFTDGYTKHAINHDPPLDPLLFKPRRNVLNMFWMIQHCNNLKKKAEEEMGCRYDRVIRARPDALFIGLENSLILEDMDDHTISLPHMGRGGYDDTFAFGTSKAMDTYSDAWTHLPWCGVLLDTRKREPTDPWWWNWFAPEKVLQCYLSTLKEMDVRITGQRGVRYRLTHREDATAYAEDPRRNL